MAQRELSRQSVVHSALDWAVLHSIHLPTGAHTQTLYTLFCCICYCGHSSQEKTSKRKGERATEMYV